MNATVEGVYKDGHMELLEVPKGIAEDRVVVTIAQQKRGPARQQLLQYGKYSEGRMSTEEDFKIAEWPGDRNLDDD